MRIESVSLKKKISILLTTVLFLDQTKKRNGRLNTCPSGRPAYRRKVDDHNVSLLLRKSVNQFFCAAFLLGIFCPSALAQTVEKTASSSQDLSTEIDSSQKTSSSFKEPTASKSDSDDNPIKTSEPSVQQTSSDLVTQAWGASGKNDLTQIQALVEECEKLFGAKAKEQQAALQSFPERGTEKDYQELNDVATGFFIYAEALMNNGKSTDAQQVFQRIIEEFSFSQSWDASRGAFWSVAEKSQASIDMMNGKNEQEEEALIAQEREKRTQLVLFSKGTEDVIDYTKYGTFSGVGTVDYKYDLTDSKALQAALGEGIYPNNSSVFKNPGYKKAVKEGRLEGSHWDFVRTEDVEAAFYKWATAPEPWGVKLFYLGLILEKAKLYYEAIKAYQAIIVHFPNAIGWTYWKTPWYPGQAAVGKIKYLVRTHPELQLKYQPAKIEIKNGFDNDIRNDVILTTPGKLSKQVKQDGLKDKMSQWFVRLQQKKTGKIKQKLGQGKVNFVQYQNGHWQMMVDKKPYNIKGITYVATKIGQSPDKGTLTNWMTADINNNGKIDGPYDSWVDANKNNEQDTDEPVVGDFELMKQMGVNTIRQYHQPFELNKELLKEMYEKHGIRVIVGDFLGKYALGSGASWHPGTDYENQEHRKAMMASVQKMVMEYKDEPFVLMWILGNENNYGVANNADKNPKAYFQFVNEVAQWIKSVDPNHPVAICNGDTLYLDIFAQYAPDVDVYGANIYRGDYGFGSYWEQVAGATGKPAMITEYGCPAYARHMTLEEADKAQSDYHLGNWLDIKENSAGQPDGIGNAIGGVAFEWMDEWWKNYEPFFHDRKSDAIGPFPGGYYFEEWFGLISQGKGKHSPFLRQLRQSYYTYKSLWNSP